MSANSSPQSWAGSRAASRNPSPPAKNFPAARVLIVEDEALLRWSVAETLRDKGFQVSEASDASSALHAFDGIAGDAGVVLLDLCLPDSDDLHVLTAMRRLSPSTPVVLMTAYGGPELS